MILTIEIPNEALYDILDYGERSLDITLDLEYLHKSREYCEYYNRPMGTVKKVWTNDNGYEELRFSIINS